MIRFTKRSLAWTFSAVFFGSVVVHMWYSVQWIFSSSYTNSPTSHASIPSSTLVPSTPSTPIHTSTATPTTNGTTTTIIPPSKPSRYERDYTTLVAYPISLLIAYCFYLITTRYRRFFPDVAMPTAMTTATPLPLSLSNNSIGCDQQQKAPNHQDQQPPLSISSTRRHSSIYLIWRRWWHYEFRCFDNTFRLGTYLTLSALCGLHALFILWPFLLPASNNNNNNDPFLQHQLLSNRIAQLALVDMAVVVGLSVRTSVVWRMIGLYNGSMTLPWHRWFARFSIFGVAYHGCFQWTKHYYRHHLVLTSQQQPSLIVDPFFLDGDHHEHSGMLLSSSSVTWWDLLVSNPHYLTGSSMVLCMLALFLGSHPLVREKWYRLFRTTHVIAFLGLVGMGMWHHWTFVVFYMAVVCAWLVDMMARLRSTRVAPIVALEVVADQVLKLKVALDPLPYSSCRCRRVPSSRRSKQPLALLPGQYVFCSFSGSKWKDMLYSHPFSISRVDSLEKPSAESSESQMLTFFIKVYGKQTKALYDCANIKERWPTVRVGTPLGHPSASCHWSDIYGLYPVVVLVAEGIGITPWMAVLHSLVMMTNNNSGNGTTTTVKHVNIIWTVRDGNMIKPFINDIEEMMATALAATKADEETTHGLLQLDWHLFVTGANGATHLDEEQQHQDMASSSNSLQQQQRHCHYQYHQGRPNYSTVLESIRLKHDDKDVALGICAHEESVKVCGNLARSSRFSHASAYWNVRSERFEL